MSHSVTVTRTTTSTTTSAIIVNTGYCKTVPGLLKVAEVIVGLALFILIHVYSNYFRLYFASGVTSHLYLFLVVFACLIASSCLLISCLFSLSTSSIIAKTLFEFVYHGVAFLLYLAAMLFYFIKDDRDLNSRHPYSTAGVLGVILMVLYLCSTIFAYRSYRGV